MKLSKKEILKLKDALKETKRGDSPDVYDAVVELLEKIKVVHPNWFTPKTKKEKGDDA